MGHRQKRLKGYWAKRTERFASGTDAKSRAGHLRTVENVSHVTVQKADAAYLVAYSVAKWYLDEIERLGMEL